MLNILFIWVGNEIPAFNLGCIMRAREIYPNAHFKIITDQIIPFEWMEIIEAKINNFKSPQLYSDYMRIVHLAEYPNTLYLDTDAYCLRPIELNCLGNAGIWAIYNHNNLELMRDILRQLNEYPSPYYYGKILEINSTYIGDCFIHREGKITEHLNKGSHHEKITTAGR